MASPRLLRRFALGVLALALAAAAARAGALDLRDLIREAFSVPSVTGSEELLAGRILSRLPKTVAETDNLGSVRARYGQGGARLALCAPLDEYGWFVSGFTQDGYLRLDRSGQPHPSYDGYLLGQPVVIATQKGLQPGVVVQPSMHLLTRERREELRRFTLDLAYVDVGARSEDEARRRGFERLDAVALWPDLSVLAGDKWAGPSLGQKAACALLLALADDLGRAAPGSETVVSWLAQTKLLARSAGAGAPRASLGAVRFRKSLQPKLAVAIDAVPADRGERGPAFGKGPALILPRAGAPRLKEAIEAAARDAKVPLQLGTEVDSTLLVGLAADGAEAALLALPVKFGQTPAEVVDLKDVEALKAVLLQLVRSERLR